MTKRRISVVLSCFCGVVLILAIVFHGRYKSKENKIEQIRTYRFPRGETKESVIALLGKPRETRKEKVKYRYDLPLPPNNPVTKLDDGTYAQTIKETVEIPSEEVLIYQLNCKLVKVYLSQDNIVLGVEIE